MKYRLARMGILGLAGLGLLATSSLVAPQTVPTLAPPVAEAAVKAKPATKHKGVDVGNTHVGSWKVYLDAKSSKWEEGYCFQPRAGHPNSAGKATDPGVLDGMNKDQSGDVKYLVQRYGGPTATNDQAAGLVLAIWTVQDEPSFRGPLAGLKRSSKLAKAVKLANAMLREMKNRGKFTGSAKVQQSGTFGQKVDVTVYLKTAYARPANGKKIDLKGSGIRVPKSATLNNGRLTVKGVVNTTGTYTVTATHVSPASGAVLVNRPSAGRQKTVMHTGATTKIVLKASGKTKAPTIKVSSNCPAPCDGVGVYRPRRTVGKGGSSVRTFVYANGRLAYSFDTKPGTTNGKSKGFPDLTKLTTGYCALSAGKCAHPIKRDGGTHVIECPEWPEFTIVGQFGCNECKVSLRVTNPSARTTTILPTIGGKKASSFTLAPGASKNLAPSLDGKLNSLSFQTKNGAGKVLAQGKLGQKGKTLLIG